MKKILLSLVVAAAALFATSCANELEEGIKGNANGVTFEISTPELASRADFGTGAEATKLLYAVYDETAGKSDLDKYIVSALSRLDVNNALTIPAGGSTSFALDLLDGNHYSVLFWAVSKDYAGAFTIDWTNKKMEMRTDIPAIKGNDESFDAFFGYIETFEVEGAVTKSATLTRPFAQLNIGTNDFTKAANANFDTTNISSKVVIEGVPTVLDCTNGTVGTTTAITYGSDVMDTTYSFPVDGYNYLAMNYVLVGDKQVYNATLTVTDGTKEIENTYNNIPLARNYKTNVYGALLTNGSQFTVDIDETWTNPAYGEVWDGVSVATPIFDETNKVMYIHDGYQLAWLAQFVNNGNVAPTVTRAESIPFDNTNAWTVEITNDINLGGKAWTPIGTGKERNFRSNFNGNGHTIKGLKVEGNLDCAALFGAIATSKAAFIKNLTIDGADIKGSHYAGAFAAWVQHPGDGQGNRITIENIHVKNSKVVSTPIEEGGVYDNGDKAGGVVGYAVRTIVENCSAEKCEVTAYRDLAGVVGVANSNATVRNCSVEDVTLKINNEHNYKGYTSLAQYRVNSVTNVIADTATAENNSGEATIVDIITEAFKEDIADGNITLSADVTFLSDEALVIEAGETVTIDLNGKTISGHLHKSIGAVIKVEADATLKIYGGTVSSTGNNGGSAILNKGTAVLEDVTLNGAPNADGSWPSYTVNNSGNLTINNSYITSYHGAVASYDNGVATLNNTNINMRGIPGFTNHGIYTYNNGTVVVNGGDIANHATDQAASGASVINGAVTVNAGTFSGRIENYYGTPVLKGGSYTVKPNNKFIAEGYKAVEANGKYVVVANEVVVVSTGDELNAALQNVGTVYVAEGEYTFPASSIKAGATIVCEEGTVFKGNSKLNINGATVVGATFSNPNGNAVSGTINGTLKNCTFDGSNGLRGCYAGETVVFEDCVFSGDVYGAHFDGGANNVVFRNCTFSGFNAFADEIKLVTFEGCTFKGNGRSGYNGANLWGSANMVDCEFTFDGTTATEWIDCIGTDKTYEFSNCTVDGVNFTDANYADFDEIFSRNSASVKINGVDCQL